MNFIIITVFIAVLAIASGVGTNRVYKFMDKTFTTVLKGLAIISVIWAHSCARMGVEGIQFIAGVGVALFLICSGYGLEKSYQKKGLTYFWKNRFLKLCIPYWTVSIVSAFIEHSISLNKVIEILMFYEGGWFIRYIILCYVIFYLCKKLTEILNLNKPCDIYIMGCIFVVWFILDTKWFADSSAPFLAARQMGSFTTGVLIARYYERVLAFISKKSLCICGGGIGIAFMAITQLDAVKNSSLYISNFLSLFTVLPLAISVLGIVYSLNFVKNSKYLMLSGILSYEIFLIHAHTNYLVEDSIISIILCFILTYGLAGVLHIVIGFEGKLK